MPRFAANLTMMYGEHAFLDRFEAAARDGFRAVEFLFPYEFDAREIRSRLDAHGLTQVLFNAPPGDWERRRARSCLSAWTRKGISGEHLARTAIRCRARKRATARDGGID